jgi:hypothetical protein
MLSYYWQFRYSKRCQWWVEFYDFELCYPLSEGSCSQKSILTELWKEQKWPPIQMPVTWIPLGQSFLALGSGVLQEHLFRPNYFKNPLSTGVLYYSVKGSQSSFRHFLSSKHRITWAPVAQA